MERIYTYLAAIVSCSLFCFQKVVGSPCPIAKCQHNSDNFDWAF